MRAVHRASYASCASGAKYTPAATGSTALRSRRALSLKSVAINFSLAGPALHLATDNHLTAEAVLLHPIRVNTTQRSPHRHEGPADAISPVVGEDARGPERHDEGLRDGSRLVRVTPALSGLATEARRMRRCRMDRQARRLSK